MNNGSTNSSILITQPDTYSLQATNTCGVDTDSIVINVINPPSLFLGSETILCIGDSLLQNSNNSGATYSWSTGSTTSSIWINQNQTIWLYAQNKCASDTDTINISFITPLTFTLGKDTILNPGLILSSGYNNPHAIYLWSTGSTGSSIIIRILEPIGFR